VVEGGGRIGRRNEEEVERKDEKRRGEEEGCHGKEGEN
jgi:hypothetical protein